MLELDHKLTLDRKAIKAANLTDRFEQADLDRIGNFVWAGYDRDKRSRAKWEKRTEAAMDLALQIQKEKSFPWSGCSNVVFPLVTIATQQFHSRAYPALVQGSDVAKCRVIGPDPTGEKKARADRISMHMSWQCLEEDKAWEEQTDRLLINLPCVGTAFKKSYFDASKGYNTSELVLAKDLVLDYWAKSVEECPRKTHIIPLFRNEIHERVLRGTFKDVLKEAWFGQPANPRTDAQTINADNRQGISAPQTDETTPFIGLEQHVEVDLDGDGYAEPYIITIEEQSKCVLRICTGFDREEDIEKVQVGTYAGKIIKVRSLQYFTKFGFIPSPDGGVYDVGFGVLLGPINESVNSALNQIFDAGTMQTTAGGFLGRGAKIRGGTYTFSPFGWQRVDSSGDDLRKSIFPLPTREPSGVLFQLLVFLVGYTNRVSGSTDPMVGENPGQNQPAETTRAVMGEGLKIYSAIFKRCWRSMKEEFKKRYILNALNMPVKKSFGQGADILREDYLGNPDEVCPAADPNIASEQMDYQRAVTIKQAAMSTPGYNLEAVERMFLKALRIDGVDQIYPGPGKVPPLPNPKMAVETMKLDAKKLQLQHDQGQFLMQLAETRRLNDAEIIKLHAQAVSLMAQAKGVETGHQIAALEAAIGARKVHSEHLNRQIELLMKAMEQAEKGDEHGAPAAPNQSGGVPRLAAAPGIPGASAPGFPGAGA